MFLASLVAQLVKNRLQCGRPGFNPWVRKIPLEKGYPLQNYGLENSMDCMVHGVTESQTRLSKFHYLKYAKNIMKAKRREALN